MANAARPVRVRIAPSPTGDPHVGTAYVALFNYVFARQQGGKFILRIEDTDQSRFRADSEQMIFDALRWSGLSWDEGPDVGGNYGPYRQSERRQFYIDHVGILLEKGEAYRCFCTEDRLAKLRIQQQAEKRTSGYDRHCRNLDPVDSRNRAAEGEPHVVRLKVPLEGPITFVDRLRGEITRDAKETDDQVLLKSDGMPTYHLANVVDDHLMEITHVVRAEEWISSTPKHVLLYKAFGWRQPEWIHLSLLRNADKSKISKRKNPVSINYYRDIGILPHAFLNFLGTMGFSIAGDRERFTLSEMIEAFSWDRVSVGEPVFDPTKLTWFNEQYIHELTHEELADHFLRWRLSRDFLVKLMPLYQQRIKRLDELIPQTTFFFAGDLDYTPVAAELAIANVAPADLAAAVLAFIDRFEARTGWTAQMLEEEAKAWAEQHAWKPKQAYPILRLAISARAQTPPLFETMATLGKELVRRRLRKTAEFIAARGKAK
ncbi:MAG TPA: glutamate--tRNA ligase [Kofleriaceae bacterium]|nr:glutamate--tRNA ligase [Kofleriaceae bacterium]